MSIGNVPDDWNAHWRRCFDCGTRFHASEGGCDCSSRCEDCGDEYDLDGLCRCDDDDENEPSPLETRVNCDGIHHTPIERADGSVACPCGALLEGKP